jgi:hypothetical protein
MPRLKADHRSSLQLQSVLYGEERLLERGSLLASR